MALRSCARTVDYADYEFSDDEEEQEEQELADGWEWGEGDEDVWNDVVEGEGKHDE